MGVVRGVGSLGVSVYKSVISASVGMGGCFQPPSSQWGAGAWGTESSRKGAVVALKSSRKGGGDVLIKKNRTE